MTASLLHYLGKTRNNRNELYLDVEVDWWGCHVLPLMQRAGSAAIPQLGVEHAKSFKVAQEPLRRHAAIDHDLSEQNPESLPWMQSAAPWFI